MKKLILSLAGAAFVAALAINLTLNKADVLAQNKLMLENLEAITALETEAEAKRVCTSAWAHTCIVKHYDGPNSVEYTFPNFIMNCNKWW